MGDRQLTLLRSCEMKQGKAVLVKVFVCVCCCRTSTGQCECVCVSVGKHAAETSQSTLAGRWDVYLCEQAHARLFVDSPELAKTLLVVVVGRRCRGKHACLWERVVALIWYLQAKQTRRDVQIWTRSNKRPLISEPLGVFTGSSLNTLQDCKHTHTHMHDAGRSNLSFFSGML